MPIDVIIKEIQEMPQNVSTSDFQSEVGEVFGEIGGELPAKFGRRFLSFFCWENRQKHLPPKLHKFHHQTSLRGSGLWRALQNVIGKNEALFIYLKLFHWHFFSIFHGLYQTNHFSPPAIPEGPKIKKIRDLERD